MHKTRVMIVDDDPSLSRLARLILEQTGRFETRVVNHACLALETARDFLPDIVLMDVDMPGKNGAEVAQEVRRDPSVGNPRILFFTALVSQGECAGSPLAVGGEQYLAKPIDPDVLVRAVDRMTPRHAGLTA